MLYRGKYAAGLVADVRGAGGVLTEADLAAAQASLKPPLRASAFGLEFLAAPPPSSGAAVIAALRMLEGGAGAGGDPAPASPPLPQGRLPALLAPRLNSRASVFAAATGKPPPPGQVTSCRWRALVCWACTARRRR